MVGLVRTALLVATIAASRHPIHAARLELVASGRAVVATLRVYRDDFSVARDSVAVAAYVARTLRLTDGRGAPIALTPTAIVAEGDRLRITLRGTAGAPLARGRLGFALLQERFADQVNVAEARIDDRRGQLVFLRGDAPQTLP